VISNLQLLRAFCALAVVYYHTGNTLFGMHSELGGVAIFFCISGFIMAYIPQRSAREFFTDRVVRIAPVYWFATLAFFFWTNSGMANPTRVWPMLWNSLFTDPLFIVRWFAGNTGLTKDGAIGTIIKSLFFVPYRDHAGDMHPLLGVGWTLNLEMFFYCIYTVAIAVRASIAPAIACVTITAVWGAGQIGLLPGTLAFYGNDYVLYFAYGIACFYAWRFVDARMSRGKISRSLTFVGAMVVLACYLAAQTNTLNIPAHWLNIACHAIATPPAVLMSALMLHSCGIRPQLKRTILLGNASYSLYLFHLFIIETMRPAGEKWTSLNTSQNAIGTSIAIALSILLGVAAYYAIERPLTRAARDALKRRTPPPHDPDSFMPSADPATPPA